jgi:hypothetical protein
MRELVITFTLTLAGLWVSPTAADNRPYSPIDPQIRRVEAGGEWRQDKRSGRYRIVVRSRFTGEHAYDDLFVEWLEHRGATSKVIAEMRVDEVGGLTFVSGLRLIYSKSGTRLEVHHRSEDLETEWTHCLGLGPPGKYDKRDGPCARESWSGTWRCGVSKNTTGELRTVERDGGVEFQLLWGEPLRRAPASPRDI